MKKLLLFTLLFLFLTNIQALEAPSKDFRRRSIPEAIQHLKFIGLSSLQSKDSKAQWLEFANQLEQILILPKYYDAFLIKCRSVIGSNLEISFVLRKRLLYLIDKHIAMKLPHGKNFLVKFPSEDYLKSFLIQFSDSKRLHPELLWAEFHSKKRGKNLRKFEGLFSRVEEDVISYRLPLLEDKLLESPPKLWGVDRIGSKIAWQFGLNGDGVIVAVVDSGVNHEHSGIKNQMWVNSTEMNGQVGVDDDGNGYVDDLHGYNFFDLDSDSADYNGHGSHVAGTIAGWDPSTDFYGVAPKAKIMSVRTHNARGLSSRRSVVEGILYSADNGAKVINCSWSGAPEAANWSQLLHDAIEYARMKGALVVAAAGNKGNYNDANPVYPACYESVISVAATAYVADNVTSFSNYGTRTVHVAAPGSAIYSMTHENNHYMRASGTSMAAPHVSGAAALIIQKLQRNRVYRVNVDEVKQMLMNHALAVPGTENKVATGIISVENL